MPQLTHVSLIRNFNACLQTNWEYWQTKRSLANYLSKNFPMIAAIKLKVCIGPISFSGPTINPQIAARMMTVEMREKVQLAGSFENIRSSLQGDLWMSEGFVRHDCFFLSLSQNISRQTSIKLRSNTRDSTVLSHWKLNNRFCLLIDLRPRRRQPQQRLRPKSPIIN